MRPTSVYFGLFDGMLGVSAREMDCSDVLVVRLSDSCAGVTFTVGVSGRLATKAYAFD